MTIKINCLHPSYVPQILTHTLTSDTISSKYEHCKLCVSSVSSKSAIIHFGTEFPIYRSVKMETSHLLKYSNERQRIAVLISGRRHKETKGSWFPSKFPSRKNFIRFQCLKMTVYSVVWPYGDGPILSALGLFLALGSPLLKDSILNPVV